LRQERRGRARQRRRSRAPRTVACFLLDGELALWRELAVEDTTRDLTDLDALVHRRRLDEAPRVLLVETVLVGQTTLGTVDELARLETLLEVDDAALERRELGVASQRDLDRGDQVALLERL